MSTFIYLLLAFVVLFIISRVMPTENRIDAFTKYLGTLACGLLLGAGAHYYLHIEQPENPVVVTASSTPTHQVSAYYSTDTDTVVSQETIERDIVIAETEGNLAQQRRIVEIEDDS